LSPDVGETPHEVLTENNVYQKQHAGALTPDASNEADNGAPVCQSDAGLMLPIGSFHSASPQAATH
jgi:hypothetical protein